MNLEFKQVQRVGKLHTAIGPDVLVLQRFDGHDKVDSLFDYTVEALSIDPNIDLDRLIGTHACVELNTMRYGDRFFDGIITEAQWADTNEAGNIYRLTLRPWLWLLSKRRNQRIFHNMSADQIIKSILGEWSTRCKANVDYRLTENYPSIEYTVQYQESELNFISRLMEQFGISYYFVHDRDSHTLVLFDNISNCDLIPGGSREYIRSNGENHPKDEYFWEWKPKRHLTVGGVRLTDYNFKKPTMAMEVDCVGDATYEQGQIESFDYPGDFAEPDQGKALTRLRTRQERGSDHRHEAVGNAMSLSSGMRMRLDGDKVTAASGQEYVCLEGRYSFRSETYSSTSSVDDVSYCGQYIFTPLNAPYAPQRVAHIPRIYGPQTATVVGDGEIDCDEFGRILVHFPWDLQKSYSMRCRVSQISAHKGWGAMVIPRIGMEVVVEFLDGDPNKPLVTGCVYNGKNKPPYELPANKSQSGFLSTTHEGAGSNQLRFEDQADKQEVFLHAQKDHNTVILNNESHDIGVDRSKKVGNDQTETIGNNKTITVGNDHDETIGNNKTLKVGNNQSIKVESNHKEKVNGAFSLKVGKAMTTVIKLARSVTVGLASTEQVGLSKTTLVGVDYTTKVGKTKKTSVGDEYVIEVGKSKLVMDSAGNVTITGTKFNFSATGNVQINGKVVDLN